MHYRMVDVARHGFSRAGTFKSSYASLLSGFRGIQISTRPAEADDVFISESPPATSAADSDARFEVIGSAPYSLLSVSLSASQNLYTRRGTLVGVGGNAENVYSTLSVLEPFRRAFLAVPFLYQKVSSTTPVTALISTNSSIAVVKMDGSIDWKLFGKALLAWTGQTLSIQPRLALKASRASWGNSEITGRGLLAIAGQGSIYQVVLDVGEEYVVHPSNVIAYTINSIPPSPYRLKTSSFRLQTPNIDMNGLLSNIRFFRVMQRTITWQAIRKFLFMLRTWSRRTIWGDRLFLEFRGPTKILLQSRASRLSDMITSKEMDAIAETMPGAMQDSTKLPSDENEKTADLDQQTSTAISQAPRMSFASIGKNGKVKIEAAEGSKV
ncbi:Altered inheritance of mitochondria protein 24, mitochondrial [Pseudocyphellaria aurata]|nr:Altered inheritance of mitochondria protein 24, mitochondrial [Pseudocyphellaria aurata]